LNVFVCSQSRRCRLDQPQFLDDSVEARGAEGLDCDPKTSCCGGSVSVYSPDKILHLIKKIVESAVDAGADVIATRSSRSSRWSSRKKHPLVRNVARRAERAPSPLLNPGRNRRSSVGRGDRLPQPGAVRIEN